MTQNQKPATSNEINGAVEKLQEIETLVSQALYLQTPTMKDTYLLRIQREVQATRSLLSTIAHVSEKNSGVT